MERARFIALIHRALADVPEPFATHIREVDIVVKQWPDEHDLADAGLDADETMYGFYRGVPLTERGGGYNMALPDIIHVYQGPLEEDFPRERELVREIRATVLHELAHFFGIDDDRLEELGLD